MLSTRDQALGKGWRIECIKDYDSIEDYDINRSCWSYQLFDENGNECLFTVIFKILHKELGECEQPCEDVREFREYDKYYIVCADENLFCIDKDIVGVQSVLGYTIRPKGVSENEDGN